MHGSLTMRQALVTLERLLSWNSAFWHWPALKSAKRSPQKPQVLSPTATWVTGQLSPARTSVSTGIQWTRPFSIGPSGRLLQKGEVWVASIGRGHNPLKPVLWKRKESREEATPNSFTKQTLFLAWWTFSWERLTQPIRYEDRPGVYRCLSKVLCDDGQQSPGLSLSRQMSGGYLLCYHESWPEFYCMLRIAHHSHMIPYVRAQFKCPTSQQCEERRLGFADHASFQHVRKG